MWRAARDLYSWYAISEQRWYMFVDYAFETGIASHLIHVGFWLMYVTLESWLDQYATL